MYDEKTLLSTRAYPESYTPQIINNIELLSFSDEGATPFGSYIYKVQKYPGDIDLVEKFEDCCSIDDVVNKFAKRFQQIVKSIIKLKKHYMTEAKIGEDNRYEVGIHEIGFLRRGSYYINDNTKANLVEVANELLSNGLLPKEEYEIIMRIVNKDYPTVNDHDILYNLFREHKVLRWSDKEILDGYKILPGNIKITIREALKHKGHVKIDMITDINNKFIEMTNFLFLIENKPDGKKYAINLGKPYTQELIQKRIETELPKEIEKLFFSAYYYNPFKGVKRLWALARHYKDYTMIDKLKPFISGNISLLYQLKSELENIMVLLKKLKSPPKVGINNQIQEIKSRLVYVLEVGDDELYLDDLFNKATASNERYEKLELLGKLKKYMVAHINYFTMEFLHSIGIDSLRPPYVPNDPDYETRYILPATTEKITDVIDNNKIKNSLRTGEGCLTCGGQILQVGGSCWTDFLKSRRFTDTYEDFLSYNNCQRKSRIYQPKKQKKNKIEIPIELQEKEELFESSIPPPPPPDLINVRVPRPHPQTPEFDREKFKKERDERSKAKEEKQIKESKKAPTLGDVSSLIAKAALERAKKKGIKEETFGTGSFIRTGSGCMTCPKGKRRQALLRKLRK